MVTQPKSGETATSDLGSNPLALVAGGVALGAVIGLLLPRIAKERELLDPIGHKLAGQASAALEAAKETGRAEIEGLLPDRDATRDKIGALFGNVVEAAKDAAQHKA